jgi:hypothetical protein
MAVFDKWQIQQSDAAEFKCATLLGKRDHLEVCRFDTLVPSYATEAASALKGHPFCPLRVEI